MEGTVTFINVLDVDPERQQELIALLKEGTEEVIRHRPGFVSLTLYASADGKRVVNVAEWRSAKDVAATREDPAAQEYAKRTARVATAAASLCSVVGRWG